MAVNVIHGFRTKRFDICNYKNSPGGRRGLNPEAVLYLVIRLPNSRVLRLFARCLILSLFVISFPRLGSMVPGGSSNISTRDNGNDVSPYHVDNFKLLSLMFHDFTNEGLLKTGGITVFVSSAGDEEEAIFVSKIIGRGNAMDFISITDLARQNSVNNDSVDFVFTRNFPAANEFIDRALKIDGIVVVELSKDLTAAFDKPSNYKFKYTRHFESTYVLAMSKIGHAKTNFATQRRLLGRHTLEAKKAALNNLEDVLLEPPRSASRKSNRYLKRTRYLPDLMGDSLESYPRRVFIDVGLPEKGGGGTSWFAKNYPTRNKDFEMYKIETVTEELSGKEVTEIGMSDWLKKNVKDEEYVVMKAEAEVVEEMVKGKAIYLVDELFLECKPRGSGGKGNGSRRAYWECLALYGQLRDEGVAVHQWWG